ncbi:hypothetical protein Nepgr_005276 [Nepenthes gracilis]|uniref:Uncharacterized protein n=1 Tax=Nepenthes gracilis TaxID=150966 RepID=A0AAD3S3A6_NEPGR|nr:hypothetical protein Nepgr_005276 [Nepenthes gracilis]
MRSSQSVLGAPPHLIFNLNSSLPAPLSSLSKSSPLGVELNVGHQSSQSPSLYSPGEPFHGPECSEGPSVHPPLADSTCCGLSSSGASPRAAVHDGFRDGPKTLSGCVDPSLSLSDSSSVGPIHPGALDAGVATDGQPVHSLGCSAQSPSPFVPVKPLLYPDGLASTFQSLVAAPDPSSKEVSGPSVVEKRTIGVQNGPVLDAPPNQEIDQKVIPISNSFKALQEDDPNDYLERLDLAPAAHPRGDGPIFPPSHELSSLDKSSSEIPNGLPLSSCLNVGGMPSSDSEPSPPLLMDWVSVRSTYMCDAPVLFVGLYLICEENDTPSDPSDGGEKNDAFNNAEPDLGPTMNGVETDLRILNPSVMEWVNWSESTRENEDDGHVSSGSILRSLNSDTTLPDGDQMGGGSLQVPPTLAILLYQEAPVEWPSVFHPH